MRRRFGALAVIAALAVLAGIGAAAVKHTFVAHLTGAANGVVTRATGEATFDLNKAGTALNYELTVKNLENAMMAHIHLAPKGKAGSVVCWLYPRKPPPVTKKGKFSGVLAKGAITAKDLAGGPLKDKPLSALVQTIEKGDAYVNVHTEQHPDGELRGQIAKP